MIMGYSYQPPSMPHISGAECPRQINRSPQMTNHRCRALSCRQKQSHCRCHCHRHCHRHHQQRHRQRPTADRAEIAFGQLFLEGGGGARPGTPVQAARAPVGGYASPEGRFLGVHGAAQVRDRHRLGGGGEGRERTIDFCPQQRRKWCRLRRHLVVHLPAPLDVPSSGVGP